MLNLAKYKRNGFTLAEVLITIGVVGVVAALTVPSLVENYQAKLMTTRLKKVYAIATSACEQMLAQDEVPVLEDTELYYYLKWINFEGGTRKSGDLKKVVEKYFNAIDVIEPTSTSSSKVDFYMADNTKITMGVKEFDRDGENGKGLYFTAFMRANHSDYSYKFYLNKKCKFVRVDSSEDAKIERFNDFIDNDWKIE